jgi:signal peptidase I
MGFITNDYPDAPTIIDESTTMKSILTSYIIFSVLLLSLPALAETIKFPSASMQPTIDVGDTIEIDRNYYEDKQVARGDVVVIDIGTENIRIPGKEVFEVVKRVVAIGGDTVQVKDQSLIVNGDIVEEDYAVWRNGGKMNFKEKTLPENTVFILGDNRDFSNDSRLYKNPFIPVENIKGKVSKSDKVSLSE